MLYEKFRMLTSAEPVSMMTLPPSTRDWVRGAGSHTQLVQKSSRLGLVVQQGATEVFVEVERDPTLSPP